MIRLFIVALVRSGRLEATSKGQVIESALTLDAKSTFSNNNLFKQASFRPKVGIEFKHVVDASEHFKETFGREIAELEQSVVAGSIRQEINRHNEEIQEVYTVLIQHHLPGTDALRSALDQMRALYSGKEDNVILTFNSSFKEIKEAIKRSAELSQALTEGAIHDLHRAKSAIDSDWNFLESEQDLDESFRDHAEKLADILKKETFFREFADIDRHTREIENEFRRRHKEAIDSKVHAYQDSLDKLQNTPGWEQLNDEQKQRVARPLSIRTELETAASQTIPLLLSECQACPELLDKAIEELLRQIDGNRIVRVSAASYFSGGIETEEQLDQAISGLKEECLGLIGAGKKVLVK